MDSDFDPDLITEKFNAEEEKRQREFLPPPLRFPNCRKRF